VKEEEKEKLHLEQQQLQHYDVYYYTKKNLRNSLFYYYKVDCWIWEWERDYGRNIMWIPVILIEHFFLLPSKLKSKKIKKSNFFEKKNFSAFFCSPFLSVIAMQDEIVVNNEESRIFYEEILCLVQ